MAYRCYYCHSIKENSIESLIFHSIEHHNNMDLSLLKKVESGKYKSFHYHIKPSLFVSKQLKVDENLHLYSLSEESPLKKGPRTSTPHKKACKEDLIIQANEEHCDIINYAEVATQTASVYDLHGESDCNTFHSQSGSQFGVSDTDNDDISLKEAISDPSYLRKFGEERDKHFPHEMDAIRRSEPHDEWLLLTKMLIKGIFPTNNLAYRLFLDVLNFYNTRNIHATRYDEKTKRFWMLGFRLFRGKFIRFMGGLKSTNSDQTKTSPLDSDINFLVPDVRTLQRDTDSTDISCETPGIITRNISAYASLPSVQQKSHKICFDGKKISQGFGKKLGEVDLFGHEPKPTLVEKQTRLAGEKYAVRIANDIVSRIEKNGHSILSDACEDDRKMLSDNAKKLIKIISIRIQELKLTILKKQYALETLLKDAGEQWVNSKYSYAISGIKTSIFRMKESVTNLLQCNDGLARLLADATLSKSFHIGSLALQLSSQDNYVCLRETVDVDIESLETRVDDTTSMFAVKQRTDAWFKLRTQAKVTGNTLHTSIGLR